MSSRPKILVSGSLCAALSLAAAPPVLAPPSPPKPQVKPAPSADPAKGLAPLLQQFIRVMTAVKSNAAEPPSTDKMIYQGAIPSMLRELDPHTQFFNPSQFAQLQQMEASEQKGFGSIVSVLPGQVIFLQTLPGTPSNKAGIQPGDNLVGIGNIAIGRLQPQQIIQLLTAARQQTITVYIRRQGAKHILHFTLTPALVDQPSVDRVFLLRPGIGYIRVTSWEMGTASALHDAVEKLGGKSLKGLVLDLRNNPGGIVKEALQAAALFLKPGQRILTAKGRAGVTATANAPKTASPYTFPLAVLIDGKTASASEILSGALQDHDRAVIVGETSYGKGLVQSVMPLANGAGLAITTAFYYTPSGRTIEKPLPDSALAKTFATPQRPQIYHTDNGRIVKGGGGIQPDIAVARGPHTRLEAVLEGSGDLTAFATQYLASHPPLPASFHVTPNLLDDLKVYLSERNIQPSVAEWGREEAWITAHLEEAIVTQARGVAQGDEIAARSDPQIQAALKAIEKQDKGTQPATSAARKPPVHPPRVP